MENDYVESAALPANDIELINNSCKEYCENYTNLPNVEEAQIQPLMDNIKKITHNLDTLKAHFESLRGDCELITCKTLPSIHSQLSQLQPFFDYIDKLEGVLDEKEKLIEDYEKQIKCLVPNGKDDKQPGTVDVGKEASSLLKGETSPQPLTTSTILKNITDLFN